MAHEVFNEWMSYPERPSKLAEYRLLGKSGMRVSPLCLGTMNFGDVNDRWMGVTAKEEAQRVFDTFISKGGNFIDTANFYQKGQSEEWLGEFVQKRGLRDDLVLASKYTLPMKKGAPNLAGNARKNMFASIDASLKRLGTHYLDLYYIHIWDYTTDINDVLRAADDLVRSGKVHHVGISDTPAWVVARGNTMAELRGWSEIVAYQGNYHLGERTMERDIIPMTEHFGMANVPWGALGGGKYTGKYKRGQAAGEGGRAINVMSDKDYDIEEAVAGIATEIGKSQAQVALAWVLSKSSMTSPLIGVRTVAQLEDTVAALDVQLSPEHIARLDDLTKIDPGFPHGMIGGSRYQDVQWTRPAGFIA